MSPGQLYGGLIEDALWLVFAGYFLYGRPRELRRQVARDELTEEEGQAKLQKAAARGYMLILVTIARVLMQLDQLHAFARSQYIVGFSIVGIAVCLIVVAGWHLWKARH